MNYLIPDALGLLMVALAILGVAAVVAIAVCSARDASKDMRHAWRNLYK